MVRGWVLSSLVVMAACTAEPAPECASFDEAHALFEDLTARVLDPTFSDPRFAPAAQAFEAVDASCPRYETARLLAQTIREGLRAPPRPAAKVDLPAPRPAAPPPAPAPVKVAEVDAPAGPDPEVCAELVPLNRKKCDDACGTSGRALPCLEACEARVAKALADAGCPAFEARDFTVQRAAARRDRKARKREAREVTGDTESKGARPGMTYCAYFTPDGSAHMSYCRAAPLPQAQRMCDADLRRQGIEGKCACNDDPAFINGRCD